MLLIKCQFKKKFKGFKVKLATLELSWTEEKVKTYQRTGTLSPRSSTRLEVGGHLPRTVAWKETEQSNLQIQIYNSRNNINHSHHDKSTTTTHYKNNRNTCVLMDQQKAAVTDLQEKTD